MPSTGRVVQALLLFSTLLGVLFLVQVYGALPWQVFYFVSAGWALFAVDSVLTFVRPRVSYYLAFVLAVLALASSLPQSVHYAFIAGGDILPSATFILSSLAQALIIVVVPFHFLRSRRAAG